MPAQIRWDPGDSAGERTLTASIEAVRFNRWTPDSFGVGEEAIAVGDGIGYVWVHRTDHLVSFEFPCIADYALLQEFQEWANNFGPFAIDTGDPEDNTYETCQIASRASDSRVTISEPDPETLEYRITARVRNIATTPIAMRQTWQSG